MTQNVKIVVSDVPTKTEVIIDGQHIESNICKYALEQEAGRFPILHLYVPIPVAEIIIEKCEVIEHEIGPGV